jgi:hypothetical protein
MNKKEKFIDYLLNLEIHTLMNLQDEGILVGKIFKYSKDITPSNLFRYRKCDKNNFSALENDEFILTKPTLFNDPYDSLLYVDRQKIIDNLTSADNRRVDPLDKLINDTDYKNSEIKIYGEEFINKWIEIHSAIRERENNYTKEELWAQKVELVDSIIAEAMKSLKQSSMVGCLSENINSILMWSHYANNHKGFALNYDFKSRFVIDVGRTDVLGSEFVDKKIFPVKYSSQKFDATRYVEFHYLDNFYLRHGINMGLHFYDKLFYYKILLFKSPEWKYEKEWRIIKPTNIDYEDNKPDFELIKNIKAKEIILGANISIKDRERLIAIARKKEIPIREMELAPFQGKYKLNIKNIT